MIDLRDYQEVTVNDIRKELASGVKHVLVQLPTGGGKTIIFCYITHSAETKGKRILILTDRDELLKQAGGSMEKFDINAGYIKAGAKFADYRRNVFIGMSQTLRKRIDQEYWRKFILEDIDMIIIDEAHIQEFNYLFEDGILNDKIVLGFTATPIRTGNMRQLGLDYEKMVRGSDVRELIAAGYLLNCDHYEMESANMDGVKINTRTGDFDTSQMFSRFDTNKLYAGLIKNYQKYCDHQKMIVFCVNVNHAIKTTKELVKHGYKAKFVASNRTKPKELDENATPGQIEKYNIKLQEYNEWLEAFEEYSGNRKDIFNEFHDGDLEILVNVDVATKGLDNPKIKVVALYRATDSLALYLQMMGRGSRIFDETKNQFTVLDFGGNKQRLGSYDQPRIWSLWHEKRKKCGGVPPLKECGLDLNGKNIEGGGNVKKGCTRLIMASSKICPFCGFKYPEKKEAKEVELSLSSIIDDEGVSLAVKNIQQMTFDELDIYRKVKKHKQGWLWVTLYRRGGIEEVEKFASHFRWDKKTTNLAINYLHQNFENE